MIKKGISILPKLEAVLSQLGENIKLARLRRKLSAEQVAERAGITRTTLWSIEKGSANVSMAGYIQVLFVLGLEKDLLAVANDDVLGRKLQDTKLIVKKRSPKKKKGMDILCPAGVFTAQATGQGVTPAQKSLST